MTTTVGQRIRERRQDAGLSQTQLAGEELSPSYVSLIEAGKRQPSQEALAVIARRLGCRPEDLDDSGLSRGIHVELEIAYARLALGHGEAASARDRLEPLLASGDLDPRMEDDVRALLADALDKTGDLLGAVATTLPIFERAVERRSHLPLAKVAHAMCNYYLRSGDLRAAVRTGERGLSAVQEQGLTGTVEHLRLAATLMWAYYELGDLTHCLAWADHVLTLAGDDAAEAGKAAVYWNAALVAETQGRVDEALSLAERALAALSEDGTTRDLPRLRVVVAALMMRADVDRAAQAAAILDGTRTQMEDLGAPVDLASWGSRRALAALLLGDAAGAEKLARQALLQFSTVPDTDAAETLITLGDSLVAQGRTPEAREHYDAAGDVLRRQPVTRQVAALWRDIAERRLLCGSTAGALEAYRDALSAAGIRGGGGTAEVAFGLRPPAPSRPATRLDTAPQPDLREV